MGSSGGDRSSVRRERILEAAAEVLAEDGFERITTRRIAQAAGVNVATLHYHFGGKEALLAAAMQHALYRTEGILREAMRAAASPKEALELAFDAVWRIITERPGVLRYDLVLRALRDPAARRTANEVYAAYRRLVEDLVEQHVAGGGALTDGMTPPRIGHYAVAAVDGILLQYLVSEDHVAARDSLDLVRRHTLSFLIPAAPPAADGAV